MKNVIGVCLVTFLLVLVCQAEAQKADLAIHSADQTADQAIDLSELLRVIQFFNSGGYHCADNPGASEDGYLPGQGVNHSCFAHDSDYNQQDWVISLSELLRLIQFFNSDGYHVECGTEDAFEPGVGIDNPCSEGFRNQVWIDNAETHSVSMALNPYLPKLAIAYTKKVGEDVWKLMYAELSQDGSWVTEEVDDTSISSTCSLELTSAGNPVIAYYHSYPDNDLYCARSVDGEWLIEFISNIGYKECSLAIDPLTNDLCIFYNSTGGDYNLYRAFYSDITESWDANRASWANATEESAAFNPVTGTFYCAFRTLSWSGNPSNLLYYDVIGGSQSVEVGENSVGYGLSLAISPSTGYPHISHHDYSQREQRYTYWNGTEWVSEVVLDLLEADTSICLAPITDEPRIACARSELTFIALRDGEWVTTKILPYFWLWSLTTSTYGSTSMVLTPEDKAVIVCSSQYGVFVAFENNAWPFEPLHPPGEGEGEGESEGESEQVIKGMAYASWTPGAYQTAESVQSLTELSNLGATYIEVTPTWYQETYSSTGITSWTEKTMTDNDLYAVVRDAHALGMKVILKPHIDLRNDSGHWRGDITFSNEADWATWFVSYQAMIIHYAGLAESLEVETFCIGTELKGTSHRNAEWATILADVASLFSGETTYAANWDEVFDITWWNALDYIGVDAYFPLTVINNPTVEQLKTAWEPTALRLQQLSEQYSTPILFTELGYRSIDGVNISPYLWQGAGVILDLQEQADCYQAFFETFWDQSWFVGVFWWNWEPSINHGGIEDTGYSPRDKPAEDVIATYYLP